MNYRTVKCSDRLPESTEISEPYADYFVISASPYKLTLAMYLKDENGECAWYTSYLSKIVAEVEWWLEPYELPTEELKKILWSLVKEYDVASLTCQDGEGDDVLIEEKAEAITNLLKESQ